MYLHSVDGCQHVLVLLWSKDAVRFSWYQDTAFTKHLDERAAGMLVLKNGDVRFDFRG